MALVTIVAAEEVAGVEELLEQKEAEVSTGLMLFLTSKKATATMANLFQ